MQRWKITEKIQKASMAEVELDEETRSLQVGDERRGSRISQTNGCCFRPSHDGAFCHDGSSTGMAAAIMYPG